MAKYSTRLIACQSILEPVVFSITAGCQVMTVLSQVTQMVLFNVELVLALAAFLGIVI